ncbi:ABC transporter [Clostridia bacterium]|nr:ABC transporter [Clostridia bacterium]
MASIELRGITKRFGEVTANDDVSLTVESGEILALLGENGSGKTTLMNMLSGIYRPDSGAVYINGEKVVIKTPEDSRRLGIGMIHQHFKLVDAFTAADNIALGSKSGAFFLTDKRFNGAEEIGAKYGLMLNTRKYVSDMSVGEKQTLEIIKALLLGARILILDEPTAVLTPQEAAKLFGILREMKKDGCAIIIITHKLAEVLEISDRVTVLRKGKSVATVNTPDADASVLTELMVGRKTELSIPREETAPGKNLLSVYKLSADSADGVEVLTDLTLELSSGEVLGVAGIAGSGQKELCECIAGLHPVKKGAILFEGENIERKTPRELIKSGISMSFIPEDRLGMGLAASLGIADNMMLKNYHAARGIFTDRRKAARDASNAIDSLSISAPGINIPVRKLSGGNVQKVLLGREIAANPKVLITAYPVRGLDINSSFTIYAKISELKRAGAGILFIGEDLDVMIELCDRIVVLSRGMKAVTVGAKDVTKEQLGLLMMGESND